MARYGIVPLLLAAACVAAETAPSVFESQSAPVPRSEIDRLVFARLKQLGIQPSNLCSDAVFVRRVYLDVTGTLPTAEEASQFLTDRNRDKRRALIDRLLERVEFADYWAMRWGDLLRIKAEFPINLWPNAAQAYHRWVWASIRENKPYDRFVRELLTESGSNFRVPPVNFYRATQSREPAAIARTVALTFMGTRAENWPQDQLAGMAGFFSQIGYKETKEWKEEIVFFDPEKPAPPAARFPDGTSVRLTGERDPREIFADWLLSPQNPWFARNIVNRIWYWLFGYGIIHEPDDIRPDNPPRHPELLAYLEKELIAARFDLKHIYRLILNSATYQLSPIPKTDHSEGAAYFAYYPLRRLDAEVLADALCQVTGTTEEYTSAIPEPFTVMPGRRSVTLPDGSISSSFLELFGRPPRDSGLAAERNNRISAAQRLHLLNSSHVQQKIQRSPKLLALIRNAKTPRAAVAGLYLTILSRFPTGDELRIVSEYSQSGAVNRREALADLAWALINSAEFLYRH